MVRARAAHATERADQAEAALEKVLAEKPGDFEARRMMADVHRFRGEFEKTENALDELWKEKNFGDDTKELAPEERAQRDLLENQYNELYASWSDALDPAKEPEKFAKVVKRGLERSPKSAQLNRKLVEFYFARGKELAEAGDKLAAAQAYEEVQQLRALPAQRKDAAQKALDLRKEAFAAKVKSHFDAAAKAKLVEAERWDAENERIVLRVQTDVDRRLRQSDDEDLATARKSSAAPIRLAIAEVVQLVAEVSAEVAAATGVKIASGDESLKRGKYEVSVSMTLDDIIEGAFKSREKARQAAEKKQKNADAAQEEPAGGEPDEVQEAADGDEPVDPGTNAGTEANE